MELQKAILKTVDEWATKHSQHPNFYLVENVKGVKYKFLDDGWILHDE